VLKGYNVRDELASRSAVPSGQAYILLLPSGQNSIILVPGANHVRKRNVCRENSQEIISIMYEIFPCSPLNFAQSWPSELSAPLSSALSSAGAVMLQREIPQSVNLAVAAAAR
jgi:hypothetical protein